MSHSEMEEFMRHKGNLTRRDFFKGGSALASLALISRSAAAAQETASGALRIGPDIYQSIGVRPFINCTATYTINGGSQMLPEVISTIAQASYYHANIDELMEKAVDRLAELLQPAVRRCAGEHLLRMPSRRSHGCQGWNHGGVQELPHT